MSGRCLRKVARRGTSHLAANAGVAESVTTARRLRRVRPSIARAKLSNPALSTGSSTWPSGVSTTWRVLRSNNGAPIAASSWRTWWLIAVGVTCSSSAARLKLEWRAAASNARRPAREGRRRIGKAYG